MLSDLYLTSLGGIEMHVQLLSRQLSERGHQVAVCTIGRRDLPGYEEEAGIKIYGFEGLFQKIPFLFKDPARKWHPPARDWLISRRLAQIIQGESPDIIHTHGWILYSVLPLKKQFKIPLVHSLHDYRLFCPKMVPVKKNAICDAPLTRSCIRCMHHPYGLLRALSAYYGVKANRNSLQSVDRFIAVSAFVKQAHAKHLGISDEDIVTIPNFYSPHIDREQKNAGHLPNDFILFAGWLMPHKGIDVLIEACQKLNTKTKLLIIGMEHPDYHYQSGENIFVVKNAPHHVVMAAMSRCKFVVIPSVWPEPFAQVAIEAMSQEKALIASDIGGLKDIIVDGETGILVPANNSDKLAEVISYLLERPEVAAKMGQRGYERFIKNYTPDVVVPRVIDVYQSLS
jgi:glycosyltransferase involved in cell wall biosynthesis